MLRRRRPPPPVSTAAEAARAYARDGLFYTKPLIKASEIAELREASQQNFNQVLQTLLIKRALIMARGEEPPCVKYAEVMGRDGARFDCRHGCDVGPLDRFMRPAFSAASTLHPMLHAVLGADCEVVKRGQERQPVSIPADHIMILPSRPAYACASASCRRHEPCLRTNPMPAQVVALNPEQWAQTDCEEEGGAHGDQSWHTDGRNALSPGVSSSAADDSAAQALTLFLPLVDTCPENGATQFVLGSHRFGIPESECDSRATSLSLPAGSIVAFDYRLWHRGAANHGRGDRPVLYSILGRPVWSADKRTKGLPSLDSGKPSLFSPTGEERRAPPSFRLDGQGGGRGGGGSGSGAAEGSEHDEGAIGSPSASCVELGSVVGERPSKRPRRNLSR